LIVEDWFGFLVKSGTPNDVVVRLNEAINKALKRPRVRDAMTKLAAEPAGGSPAEFGEFLRAQLAYWNKIVKDSGIKMHQ
jgi:tripartite-type tricarboxylate transporter receptor subunit TctC